jgi:hypothetical protein
MKNKQSIFYAAGETCGGAARGIVAEPPSRPQVREAHAVEAVKVMERIARREHKKNSTFLESAVFFV